MDEISNAIMLGAKEIHNLREQKSQLKEWLKEQIESLHNISGDNFTTVGQAVYEKVLKKMEEIENDII